MVVLLNSETAFGFSRMGEHYGASADLERRVLARGV
jgi:hypothetical protein